MQAHAPMFPMKFSELVSYTKEYGKLQTDLLIVIPSFNAYDKLLEHLGLLAAQSYASFNALLVLGVGFPDQQLAAYLGKKKYQFGIIIAKENDRRGCSGGFFTGQKYALENNYAYVIMADDDCLPVDKKLVESLYAFREKTYVTPYTRFVADGYKKHGFSAGPSQYSLYSVEIFKKYGLYYLPLFHGADDGEYMERVKQPHFQIDCCTEHPYNLSGKRLFGLFDRSWLFMLQALIIIKSARALVYNLLQFVLLLSISLFFLPTYGASLFFTLNQLLLTFTFGKKAANRIKSGYEKYVFEEKETNLVGFIVVDDTRPSYIDSPILSRLLESVRAAMKNWRKDVFVKNTYSMFKVFFLATTAKKVYVQLEGGKCQLLADNANVFVHVAKLIMFAFFVPLYTIVVFAVFVPVKLLKQPHTLGYGLD